MEGDGIIDWLKNKFQSGVSIASKLAPLRDPRINPPDVRKWLDLYGNQQVVSLKAKRVPVESAIQTILNVVSLGALRKAIQTLGYDNIFHLSLVINDKYELDKREVITVRNYQKKANEELIDIPLNNKRFTIRQMLDNTAQSMGDLYGSYSPQSNNCQDFIIGILTSNGVGNADVKKWIKQDAEKIFAQLPSFSQKFAKFISGDFAGRINRLIQGEGMNPTPRQKLIEKIEESTGKSMKREKQKRLNDMVNKIAGELQL